MAHGEMNCLKACVESVRGAEHSCNLCEVSIGPFQTLTLYVASLASPCR